MDGDGFSDLLVGEPGYDSDRLGENTGRVLLFLGSKAGLAVQPAVIFEGTQKGAEFGSQVAFTPDINEDGILDILVSARNHLTQSTRVVVSDDGVVNEFPVAIDADRTDHRRRDQYRDARPANLHGPVPASGLPELGLSLRLNI